MTAYRGYFVIADITGYTAFLTGSELDHAQDILKTLFDIPPVEHQMVLKVNSGAMHLGTVAIQ